MLGTSTGAAVSPSQLQLPSPACLRRAWTGPQPAKLCLSPTVHEWAWWCLGFGAFGYVLSPLFCEWAWCLRLGAFYNVAIPQSDFAIWISSLRLPMGHSGPGLTLSNAAPPPTGPLLVADAGASACFSAREPAVRHHNLWVLIIYLFFPSLVYVALCGSKGCLQKTAVRVFQVFESLSFKNSFQGRISVLPLRSPYLISFLPPF